MMPSPSTFDGDQPVSASTPREIRAALAGEEIAHFDREYRRAMADAAESLDLSGVVSMLKRWQRVAWSTQDDPDAHRHMLACADELNAGGDVATESWRRTKASSGHGGSDEGNAHSSSMEVWIAASRSSSARTGSGPSRQGAAIRCGPHNSVA
jgi:uncharacterized protein DUF6247